MATAREIDIIAHIARGQNLPLRKGSGTSANDSVTVRKSL